MKIVRNFLTVVGGAIVGLIMLWLGAMVYEVLSPKVLGQLKRRGIIPVTEEDFKMAEDEFFDDDFDDTPYVDVDLDSAEKADDNHPQSNSGGWSFDDIM